MSRRRSTRSSTMRAMRPACVQPAARRWPKASSSWCWIRRSTRSARPRSGKASSRFSRTWPSWCAIGSRCWRGLPRRSGSSRNIRRAIQDADLAENLAFLGWLADNHFTFLGCRDYVFRDEGEGKLEARYESGLGVLADPETRVIRRDADRSSLTPELREFLTQPAPHHHHQIEHAVRRPSPRAYGLYRREEFRPERQAHGRTPLRGTVHLGRLRTIAERDSAAAAQGGACARKIGAAAVEP